MRERIGVTHRDQIAGERRLEQQVAREQAACLAASADQNSLQVGVAWTTGEGAQLSLGLVERELRYNDLAGTSDVEVREQFAAFSYTLRFR